MLQGESNRAATATTLLGYCDHAGLRIFSGSVAGVVPQRARGKSGFGWDPIFQPLGSVRSFAEMDGAEKDRFSMRRLALEEFQASGLLSR